MLGVVRLAPLAALALGLAGCAGDAPPPPGQPAFYDSLARAEAEVNPVVAASMISGYRRNNGLSEVTVDPALTRMAQEQARLMASRDKMDHAVGGDFASRMKGSGFQAKIAVENIGAGYHTLAEAFSGWRDSPGHRANMLKPGVTRIGIATAYSSSSKYKVFWALVLAAPDDRKG
jgi:uncharacterized protein YkwD